MATELTDEQKDEVVEAARMHVAKDGLVAGSASYTRLCDALNPPPPSPLPSDGEMWVAYGSATGGPRRLYVHALRLAANEVYGRNGATARENSRHLRGLADEMEARNGE